MLKQSKHHHSSTHIAHTSHWLICASLVQISQYLSKSNYAEKVIFHSVSVLICLTKMCLHCLFLAIILEILLSSIQKCHSWAQHSTLTPQLSQNITKTLHWVVSIYAFFLSFYRSLKPRFLSPQRENKESRSPRSGAVDLPVVTDSIRNIKSMWEKGNVFSSPGSGGSTFKVKKKKRKK